MRGGIKILQLRTVNLQLLKKKKKRSIEKEREAFIVMITMDESSLFSNQTCPAWTGRSSLWN